MAVVSGVLAVSLGEYLDTRPPSQVVSFDVETTFPDALLKSSDSNLRTEKLSPRLEKCNILSAPLFDDESSTYYGFVDCWDILCQVRIRRFYVLHCTVPRGSEIDRFAKYPG